MRAPAVVLTLLATAAAPAAAAPTPKLLPFPNNKFTVKDKSTATGIRLNLQSGQMPKNKDGVPLDPTDINRFDGFSPGSVILVRVPSVSTPAQLAKLHAVSLADIGAYTKKKAPVTVTDAKSHKRWPIWVELDSNATSAATTLVEIHPAKNFLEGHTYVVNMGRRHKPWRFTVASGRSLSERMLAIRNDAFKQLGDTTLADGKVDGAAPKFNVTAIDTFTPDQNADIATRVTGTFQVPCYLDDQGCGPGGKFNLDPKTGLPAQLPGNEITAPFDCVIPRSASGAAPARVSLYGHGLLGKETEVEAGNVEDMAFEHDIVFCATKWAGMSADDVPNAISVLNDGSRMPTIADRLQQGMLDFLYLGRLMLNKDGFPANSAFAGLVDTSHLYYDGNSQGGIMGGALTAFAPDYTHATLGVPGMNYSVLLLRSKDWGVYSAIFNPAYPNELDRPLVIDLLQLMWDRGEADGVAQHMTTHPYADTPAHEVLMQPAVGDFQVSTYQAEVEARTIGARLRVPRADAGRLLDKPWGLKPITKFPYSGSAIVFWDSGPGHNGTAPLTNIPNASGSDPHENPRATKAAREQKSAFLMPDGVVTEVCPSGQECRTDVYTP